MANWQEMDTAPKDGTEFICCYPLQGCVMQLTCWNTVHGYWQSKGQSCGCAFALWHPLPEPPDKSATRSAISKATGAQGCTR
jgi:hypothetical protein